MSTPKQSHISQPVENWEVEDQSQTLAQEADEATQIAAGARKTDKVVVHTAKGRIEVEIPVKQSGAA